MIKTISTCCSILLLALTIASCGGKDKKEETKPAAPDAATAPAEPAAENKKGMSVAEAKDFLDADDANSGKEVTVSAYSWGSNERMDGKIQLNLGDEKLEGMQSASFACMFGKDEASAVKAIAKDALVTVTGKINKGAGGVELNDCKLQ